MVIFRSLTPLPPPHPAPQLQTPTCPSAFFTDEPGVYLLLQGPIAWVPMFGVVVLTVGELSLPSLATAIVKEDHIAHMGNTVDLGASPMRV